MGELVLKNVRTYYDGRDLTGDINSVTLAYSADMLDKTVFGSSGRRRRAGMRDVSVSLVGFYNPSTMRADETIWPDIGSTGGFLTMLPDGTGLGNVSYFTKNLAAEYAPGGAVGDLLGFSFAGNGDYDLIRGEVIAAGWASTEANTAQALPEVTTSRTAYLNIQCVKSSGAAGASIKVEVARSTDSFVTSATTLWTQALTTASVSQAFLATTKVSSTLPWSYRIATIQAGTSAKRLNVVVSVAHQ